MIVRFADIHLNANKLYLNSNKMFTMMIFAADATSVKTVIELTALLKKRSQPMHNETRIGIISFVLGVMLTLFFTAYTIHKIEQHYMGIANKYIDLYSECKKEKLACRVSMLECQVELKKVGE